MAIKGSVQAMRTSSVAVEIDVEIDVDMDVDVDVDVDDGGVGRRRLLWRCGDGADVPEDDGGSGCGDAAASWTIG
jgi:hypothetical protein